MERSVLDELSRLGRGLRFISFDPRQNLLRGNLLRNWNTSGNTGNRVSNLVTPCGNRSQHFLAGYTAVFSKAMVAVDHHTSDEFRLCGLAEVDASQRIFMS